jgi:hypothetical protein
MVDKKQQIVQLNDHMALNWHSDAGPVAILNLTSTVHERVAYCYGLVAHLDVLADLGTDSSDSNVSSFANLISSALVPLLATLENLGDETCAADKGGE